MAEESERPEEAPADEPRARREIAARTARELRSGAGSLLERPFELARAVVLGIRDTAHDVAKGAREEANAAYEERWARFEQLTKHRREPRK